MLLCTTEQEAQAGGQDDVQHARGDHLRAVGKGLWNITSPDGELICLLKTMLVPELDVVVMSLEAALQDCDGGTWQLHQHMGSQSDGHGGGAGDVFQLGC